MYKKYKKKSGLLFITIMAILFLVGCPSGTSTNTSESGETADAKPNVLATTTMLADLAKNIGKDKVEVHALMNAGVDPHLYKASAGDVDLMQKADILIYNGLHLEAKLGEIIERLESGDKHVINIGKTVREEDILKSEDDENYPDPHIWFDVMIWKQAAKGLEEGLSKADPSNASYYKEQLANYEKQLDELHQYVSERVQEVPKAQRIMVTAHDAFRYFGKAYGFEVKGLQGISTESEAGTSDVKQLADFLVSNKIKAIFVESSVPKKNVEALQEAAAARGMDIAIGGELYSDSLGDPDSEAATYIGTIRSNIDTIVNALK